MSQKKLCLIICLAICVAHGIPVCGQPVSINFQPPGKVPAGYLPDFGEVFGDRGDGFSYGWTKKQSGKMSHSPSSSFSDLRYDTLVYRLPASSEAWEIALEDGVYDLLIVCANAGNTYQDNTLDVEGVILRDPDFGDRLDQHRVIIQVQDGRLTVRSWSSTYATLCFMDIHRYVPCMLPFPKDAAQKVPIDVLLHWTPATTDQTYNVYLGEVFEDVNAIATPKATGLDVNSFDPGRLKLNQTYYWRVDEVNSHDTQSVHPGLVWSFATSNFIIVDDFERYNNVRPNRPWCTWLDGLGFSASEYYPDGYDGNATGSGVGYDILSILHGRGSHMEEEITMTGSSQSLPLYYFGYKNSVISQTDRRFDPPQNWSTHGSQTLTLHFYGNESNELGSLYALINGERVTYPDNSDLQRTLWHTWPIDLGTLDTNLNAVTNLSIGVESSGKGLLLLDDILLIQDVCNPGDIRDPGTESLVARYSLDGHTLDTSGHGHNGVVRGEPTYEEAIVGEGLAFDGRASQFVDLGFLDPSEGTGQFTVSMWVKRTGYTSAYQGVMGKRNTWSSNEMMWQIEVNQNNGVISLTRPDEQVVGRTPGIPFGDWPYTTARYKWAHMAVTYDGEMARLYVHGLEVGSGPFTLGPDTDATLVLGACGANGENPFHGVIDEIAIYNRALSLGELRYLAGDR